MRQTLRHLLGGLLALALSLTLLAGCGSDDNSGDHTGMVGRSYVYGTLDGALASQHIQVFSPQPWHGETDGPLLLSGDTLLSLSETEKNAARTLLQGGQAVLVTSATQPHIEALHALIGTPAALSLDRTIPRHLAVEVYGFARPHGLMRMMVAPPFPALDGPEPESSQQERTTSVAHWFLEEVRGAQKPRMAARQSSADLALSSQSFPWTMQVFDAMPVYWSTCGIGTQQCVNHAQLSLSGWMVYLANPAIGQPSDFFIMQMSANLSTAGCKGFYGNRTHSSRIAAYWLRQANLSASVVPPGSPFSLEQLSIPSGYYAPVATNPANTTTTGISWSLSGTGTAGGDSDGPSGNLAFGAGVSYSDSSTATYNALDTRVNIGATASNAASWTYDSWNFVHQYIEPANHACGGPGLNTAAALPEIIYGGTFSPTQTWLWAAQPSVRSQLTTGAASPTLPVNIDASLLLGWTYYTAGIQTCTAQSAEGTYYVQDLLSSHFPGAGVDIVGTDTSLSNGLNFDVSCDVRTNYGTIPLGPLGPHGQNNPEGNPGVPYALGNPTSPGAPYAWAVNVPFAPTGPATLMLTALSPTSGLVGTVVTLTGTHLNAATTVNFGGTAITGFSYTPQGTIQVTAPQGKAGETVQVSVGNAAGISNTLPFTYTQ